jgi:hypothetical protein
MGNGAKWTSLELGGAVSISMGMHEIVEVLVGSDSGGRSTTSVILRSVATSTTLSMLGRCAESWRFM